MKQGSQRYYDKVLLSVLRKQRERYFEFNCTVGEYGAQAGAMQYVDIFSKATFPVVIQLTLSNSNSLGILKTFQLQKAPNSNYRGFFVRGFQGT